MSIVQALAASGHSDEVAVVAADAETVARSITDPDQQADALTGLARALTAAGHPEQAETVARSITDPFGQALALTGLARALTDAGPANVR